MAGCPYTWIRSFFPRSNRDASIASQLRVSVIKKSQTVVDVALPANSARWLIDLIPSEVMAKIRAEEIPIDEIQEDLAGRKELHPTPIFNLVEPERSVLVWLE